MSKFKYFGTTVKIKIAATKKLRAELIQGMIAIVLFSLLSSLLPL
jgi:hypothetical protein